MIDLTRLDDLAYESILSHLNYHDIHNLAHTCRALRSIVSGASLRTLNCTKCYHLPIDLLPYAPDHCLMSQPDWRVLTYKAGNRKDDLYLSKLLWTSSYINTMSLRNVVLDGTLINVLDVVYFVTKAPHLVYLSVRFCTEVNSLLLQNFLDTLSNTNQVVYLERLDVLGIQGIPFFEPMNNGPEFDYQDRWREDMYDFKMSLERVPTHHKRPISTDLARCSQSYCRNFSFGRKELADPTISRTLADCTMCGEKWTSPLCRVCINGRSCKICNTFVCPKCYSIDNDIELHDLSTSQRWMQNLTTDHARGGGAITRDCRADIKLTCHGSAKAALMMQLTHRQMARMATAKITLEEGWL